MQTTAQNIYFNRTFISSHNSYSGNLKEFILNALWQQLDAGERFIEIDVHEKPYTGFGQEDQVIGVGHYFPGQFVSFINGNPECVDVENWLRQINSWSDAHQQDDPKHDPISIFFELKNSYAWDEVQVRYLKDIFTGVFGGKVFQPNSIANKYDEL